MLPTARRERRIVDLLNRGVSVAEIAAREEVTEKRMRALVSEILARRMPEPPAEFLALQVSRLNEALLVVYSAMSGANLKAVDLAVKIVRELDRYHGFAAAGRRVRPDAARLEHEDRLALDARLNRRETAPQDLEKAESAPGNGIGADAPDPQDAAPIRDEASSSFLETPAQESLALDAPPTSCPEMVPQALEKAQILPGNGVGARAPQDAAPVRDEPPAPGLETPAQEALALDAPPADHPETAPQEVEKSESAPGNGGSVAWARPLGGASFVSPAVASPGAFGRVNVRATLNGVAAC